MFRYEIARTDELLSYWHSLRTRLYLESGLIAPSDLDSDGRYLDEYDSYSTHLLAYDESAGAPIGCCRLIDGRAGVLQVTKQFDLVPNRDSFEVSGTAVEERYRKTFATLGLYRAVHALAVRENLRFAYMEVEEPFMTALRAIGLPVEVVSPKRFVFNTWNLVLRVEMEEVVPSLLAADAMRGGTTTFGRYFEDDFRWTLRSADILPATDLAATTVA